MCAHQATPTRLIVQPTSVDNGQFRIELSATRFNITEGGDTAGVSINVVRQNGHSAPIKLTLETDSVADAKNVSAQFSDDMLSTSETQSDLWLKWHRLLQTMCIC